MNYDYSKWNDYTIGKVTWINSRKKHLSKLKYIEYITTSSIGNILEIGAGEVLEGQEIRRLRPDINYNILDVSDIFLENARKLGFNVFKGEMFDTKFEAKEFDLVYLSAVLEHSPDIEKTMRELSRISKSFYFNMFKWYIRGGNLKSSYYNKRKFFTSVFNINQIFNLIKKYGVIDQLFVCTKKGQVIDYDKYIKLDAIKNMKLHRNGNDLVIIGRFK